MGAIDFGRRSADYARFRPGLPAPFYERLERLAAIRGSECLDLGTGPGLAALELARRGARVTGLDISPSQIEAARRAAADQGLAGKARFRVAPAEETGLPDASFDLVTAAQSWGWFDHARAAAEVRRMLRPGGLLVVAQYCYLPRRSTVAALTEELILRHNPGWTMAGFDGLYPQQIDGLQSGGLALVEQFCFDHLQPFTHEQWRGRIRTCNGVGSGPLADRQVEAFDGELALLLRERWPDEPLCIPHRVWAVILEAPGPPRPPRTAPGDSPARKV